MIMIRQKKDPVVPNSLLTTKRYDGEDVKGQLLKDHHNKCYICERKLITDFEIEHLKSRHKYPQLEQEWSNLFLACRYCNSKKSDAYDENVNPLTTNVEEEIEQRIDILNNKAVFKSNIDERQHRNTAAMLETVYNGNGMRKIKEQQFFNYALQIMNEFSQTINDFLMNPTPDNKNNVSLLLSIDSELLGFKYWKIRDLGLEDDFHDDLIWNKGNG